MLTGLKTIRAKMLLVVVFIMTALSLAMILLSVGTFHKYKELQISECRSLIAMHGENINDAVRWLQNNARELALSGELFYRSVKNDPAFGRYAVMQNFRINTLAVGGGIWYEPFILDPERERVCFYAFTEKGQVVFDASFEEAIYHYPSQSWYTSIRNQILNENKVVAWTPPYIDGTGTHALMTTVGGGIYDAKGRFVGLSTVDWQLGDIANEIATVRPTPNSFVLFADLENDYILALNDKHQEGNPVGASLKTLPWFREDAPREGEMVLGGLHYLSFMKKLDNGMLVVINIPSKELFQDITRNLRYTVLTLFATLLLIVLVTYRLLDHFINKPVAGLSRMAEEIGSGKLDTKLELRTKDELGRLGETLNRMAVHLKEYIENLRVITSEKERLGTELSIARNIQASMLPSIFPPFPDRKDFSLHAVMMPAKEVGGDFYDFFFTDEDHLAFVIADVSDKGVPAALFMVITKTLIKNNAFLYPDLAEVFTRTNAQLFENNGTEMFVTAFMGLLNLRTGAFSYVNAGHDAPFIRRAGLGFEKLKVRPGFVLAGLEQTSYQADHLTLSKGDGLFLYTDGVTEAADSSGFFFGDERLHKVLNQCEPAFCTELHGFLASVQQAIDEFVQDAPQSDDIAMLGLFYTGASGQGAAENSSDAMRWVPARLEFLPQLLEVVEERLEENGWPPAQQMRFMLAAEEAFVNIVHHAYPEAAGEGRVGFRLDILSDPLRAVLSLVDEGIPFNPLEKAAPDLSLSAEEREEGGLGIFLVGRNTDGMEYAYEEGRNVLKLTLFFKA